MNTCLITELREAALWLREEVPDETPKIESLEVTSTHNELLLYAATMMERAADRLGAK